MGPEAKELYAFLKAVQEKPADTQIRQVFSDWLEEHDEPDLADVYRKEARYILSGRKEAEDWLRDFCKRYGADYDELLESVKNGDGYCFGDDSGPEAARYDDDFWKYTGILVGGEIDREQSFRCAC